MGQVASRHVHLFSNALEMVTTHLDQLVPSLSLGHSTLRVSEATDIRGILAHDQGEDVTPSFLLAICVSFVYLTWL